MKDSVCLFVFTAQADLRSVLRRTFAALFTFPTFLVKTLHYLFFYFLLYCLQENQKLQASQTEQQKLAINSSCHTLVVVVVSAGWSGVVGSRVGVSLLIGGSKLPAAFNASDERIPPSCATRFRVVGDVEGVHFYISGSTNSRIYSMNILLCWPNRTSGRKKKGLRRSEIQRQGQIFKRFLKFFAQIQSDSSFCRLK